MSQSRRGITLEEIREEADNFNMALAISASLAEKERNLREKSNISRNQDEQNSPPPPFRYNKPNIFSGIDFPTVLPYEVNNENDLMIQPVIVRQRKPSPPQVQNTPSTPKPSGPRNGKLKIDNNQCCLIFLLGFIFILAIFMATLSIVIGFQNTAKKSLGGNENVDDKITLVSAAQNGFTHMVKALVKNSRDDEKSEGKGGIIVF